MENQAFGEYLREIREKFSISMRSLATSADMDPAYLSRIENGKSGAPKQETVEKLGEALCAEQKLEPTECERLKRRLLIAAGHLQGKEDLIDDLADRFATRLRDEGFPEDQIEQAIARVSLPTMRAVLLGDEKLEIGWARDYSNTELEARTALNEDIVAFSLIPTEEHHEPSQTRLALSMGSPRVSDSAASYLDRHAEDFASRRRSQRVRASGSQRRNIRAGQDAVITINKDISKEQEQQLRLIAKLINSILES